MGQQFSQPKLSAEITRNRIRETCLRDDTMAPQLKNFKIKLLVNDLNALGFDISTESPNGRAYSNDQLCQEIRKKTTPSVENVCMLDGRSSKDARNAVELMAKHFNKYYGARISIYKNPLDPSLGKRNVADLCDDLYLVSDKMERKLNDRPKILKKKLQNEIQVLKNYKKALDEKFNSSVITLKRSMDTDNLQKDLDLSAKLYKIISAELAQQLQLAKAGYSSIDSEFHRTTDKDLEQLLTSSGNSNVAEDDMRKLGNLLADYRKYRFANDENSRAKKVEILLSVLKTLPTAVDSCEGCIRKFGMQVDDFTTGNVEELTPRLNARFQELMRHSSNDKKELRELAECYNKLRNYQKQCGRALPFSSQLSSSGKSGALQKMGDIRSAAAIVSENFSKTVAPQLS